MIGADIDPLTRALLDIAAPQSPLSQLTARARMVRALSDEKKLTSR